MKNIAFFLLFFLLVSGHSNANAVGGSIGGWQVVSNVANGIGAKITATKDVLVNGEKTTVTGTANIMPDPSNMGKFMARLGGAAVDLQALVGPRDTNADDGKRVALVHLVGGLRVRRARPAADVLSANPVGEGQGFADGAACFHRHQGAGYTCHFDHSEG